MTKKNLVVSFSGGETSAYMAYWIYKNWSSKYNIVFVFANTGEEHEETLKFIEKCSKYWGINVYWVEAKINGKRKGTTHKIVDFETASRKGEPFEQMIKKYGIPNHSYKHCNRELKLEPITDFIETTIGWKEYYTAIGLRIDEFDRISKKRKKNNLLYPLITDRPMDKKKINFWWSQQDFRLTLKGYEGNCKSCWKKSDKKLWRLAKEHPSWFDSFKKWEKQFEYFYPESQNRPQDKPIRFFRNHRSVKEIFEEADKFEGLVVDDHLDLNYQMDIFDSEESCDIYSECGD